MLTTRHFFCYRRFCDLVQIKIARITAAVNCDAAATYGWIDDENNATTRVSHPSRRRCAAAVRREGIHPTAVVQQPQQSSSPPRPGGPSPPPPPHRTSINDDIGLATQAGRSVTDQLANGRDDELDDDDDAECRGGSDYRNCRRGARHALPLYLTRTLRLTSILPRPPPNKCENEPLRVGKKTEKN